jgi:hypothetical protein
MLCRSARLARPSFPPSRKREGTTVSITVGSTTVSQTFTSSNPVFDFGPIALPAGSQGVQVNFSLLRFSLTTPFNHLSIPVPQRAIGPAVVSEKGVQRGTR